MQPLKRKSIMNQPIRFFGWSALCMLVLTLTSCDEQSVGGESEMQNVKIDSSRTDIVNISGNLFSIPSPIQTAILIKETDTPYNRESLSEVQNAQNYAGKNSKALNLGVYGTDMAYASLYDDGQTALRHFKAVENLANELEIKNAIDPSLIKRLGSNVGNPDSLLLLSGKFYRAADAYLKENERYDIAALILAGGWVESAHLTALAANNGNYKARQRLAAQKKSIETLCKALKELGNEKFLNSDLKANLDSLNMQFDEVTYNYTYEKPETKPEEKTTIIKSNSSYEISDEQLAAISNKIEEIRSSIIQ